MIRALSTHTDFVSAAYIVVGIALLWLTLQSIHRYRRISHKLEGLREQ